MSIVWGIFLIVIGMVAWGGQAISWFSPSVAARLGLAEAEESVEPVFWADGRGEAAWDIATLWTLMVAGWLLSFDSPAWPYFGMIGGGIYAYFGGRGILTRGEMRRRGFRVGTEETVRVGYWALAIWGVAGLITIALSVAELT